MSAIRQQLVDAIETRLGLIAPGHVFQLPSGPHVCDNNILGVYPWRKVPFSQAQIPAIAFWDADAPVQPGPVSQHEHSLKIALEVHVAGNTAATTARSIMQDILAAIGSDPRWGNLARWTDIDSHEIAVDQAGDVIAGVSINFTVTYRTALWRM